jgi:hypothetical protein
LTAHELARELLRGDDVRVVVRGYEDGVNDITKLFDVYLRLDTNINLPYYGRHGSEDTPLYTDYSADPITTTILPRAIELRGRNK